MEFKFLPEKRPFPLWLGPYSPARGSTVGVRFHAGEPGVWVPDVHGSNFWFLADSYGTRILSKTVKDNWGGGRILFLPSSHVIKPLPGHEERGYRVVIGRFEGSIVFNMPSGEDFNLDNPGSSLPGDLWPGPNTIGLECVVHSNGSLTCSWQHCDGEDDLSEVVTLVNQDPTLAMRFKRARPRDQAGRVHLTAHGHVYTNRKSETGEWLAYYVTHINTAGWNWSHWIGRSI